MLVLSRQRDESILVGDDLTVTVVDIRGDKVRLGFQAPSSFQVYRKELYLQILKDIRRGRTPPPAREGKGMLVLSRQRDESVVVLDPAEFAKMYQEVQHNRPYEPVTIATFTLVDIRGDKVRVGTVADKEVSVHRKEVYDAIRRENRAGCNGQSVAC